MLMAALSLLLAIHALVVSRFLPSSLFLIVSFCWLWVAAAALLDRLEAVRAMASTMTVILLLAALIVQTTSSWRGDMSAFYFLAMFPSLVAWVCFYAYARHLQRSDDVSGRLLESWFEDRQAAERRDGADQSRSAGLEFTEEMLGDAFQDNEGSPAPVAHGRRPKLKAAG
jgi:hypothetical protein